MLKKILIGLGVLVLAFILWVVYGLFIADPVSPVGSVSYSDKGIDISVDYSRPYKKDRVLFGAEEESLQPYGKYWRLGANAATEIEVSSDVNFGGKDLEAGRYRMYAIPGKDAFEIILNNELDVFMGAFEPDHSLDLMTVSAPVTTKNNSTEQFTISFSSDSTAIQMNFDWGNTSFSVPITNQ